jgi:RNA polymerase sigma-70 factor (ECF subfamily)
MVTTGTLSENETKNANTEELFRKYGPMVLRRCRRILGDSCDATDAAQEVFVKALESKNALSAGVSSSLLWSIATNHCLNILRDKARRGGNFDGELLLEEIVCTEDMEARISCRSILRNLFSRHPQSSRTIAYLHLIDGMTLEETARMVNMSVSGVRKRLTALRETLGEMEGI